MAVLKMAVLKAYLDDSGDAGDPKEQYLTIAGFLAHLDLLVLFRRPVAKRAGLGASALHAYARIVPQLLFRQWLTQRCGR
jgi:hypothetical protein